jgi:hypothetical protein
VFDNTVLSELSRNGSTTVATFTGSVTQLPNGQFERSFSHTIPCVPNKKYEMTVQARVGGVTLRLGASPGGAPSAERLDRSPVQKRWRTSYE